MQNEKQTIATTQKQTVWAYEGSPYESAVNSCFLATARLLASVVLAIVLIALPLPLLIGLVLCWLLIGNLTLLLVLRSAAVALFVV